MPNISTLARTFTKVTATLEIWSQKLTASDCSIRVTQSFLLFLGLNCFCGNQTNILYQLYIYLIQLIWNIPQFFSLKFIPELLQHNGHSSIPFVKLLIFHDQLCHL